MDKMVSYLQKQKHKQLTSLLATGSIEELVKDVKRSLIDGLANGTRFLQQVYIINDKVLGNETSNVNVTKLTGFDICASNEARSIEIDADEFTLRVRACKQLAGCYGRKEGHAQV